jgi:transposase
MNELLIGIDWSQSHYDVAVIASDGVLLTQFRISKTQSGFGQLAEKIDKFGLPSNNCHIGLETAHNILIDFLWSRQYSVYVVAPSIVNSSRGRFGSSGAYTDARDAHLIADLLRTDWIRFAPWRPDSELVTTMKTKLAQVTNMTKLITGQTNRLRAILLRV